MQRRIVRRILTLSSAFLLAGAAGAVWPAEAAGGRLDTDAFGSAINVLGALVVVLALLFVAAWAVRRLQRVSGFSRGSIQVVSQLPLGVKERVLLLRIGEENVLVGCTPGGIRALHVWQGPCPEPEEMPRRTASFAEQLRGALGRGKPS